MSTEFVSRLSRQELTRLACDALAAAGKKPSIGLVREWTIAATGAKKGSDGDVQKDINGWFDDLLKLKRDIAIDGLPDAVGSLARDFWRLAVDSANDAFAGERDTLAAHRADADKQVALAREKTLAAVAVTSAVTARLDIANETIAGRDEAIRRLEDSLSEARATLRAKDERIAGLSDELARTAQQQAAGLVELDGLRKYSLLQIDQARGEVRHWKAEFERVDQENRTTLETYRQKASSLATDLSGARGRLSAIEEALTSARLRNADLEHRMSAAQTERPLAQPQPRPVVSATKRTPGAGKGMASALRRRKLGS
jgi:hypothetical protein